MREMGLRRLLSLVVCAVLALGLLGAAGCARPGSSGSADSKKEADDRKGYGMGGVDQDIAVPREWIDNKPDPWDLRTPESAVRSYLDWVSYAYRTSLSEEASPTMSPYQVVRVDAYNQHNLQEAQLMDQTLESITFGKPSAGTTSTSLPATEKWTYRYVSIREAGKTLKGPFTVEYETTYTLVKNDSGGWVVDNIDVKALGEVK